VDAQAASVTAMARAAGTYGQAIQVALDKRVGILSSAGRLRLHTRGHATLGMQLAMHRGELAPRHERPHSQNAYGSHELVTLTMRPDRFSTCVIARIISTPHSVASVAGFSAGT
jgi:hypothetical protein